MTMNNNDNLVSVVMPAYNHERFISAAVESVLRQTYSELELIIVDNFSQDKTAELVAAYADPRIRYVKFANNGVVAASRNHGIKLSKGGYVAFIDSDDQWLPEKLEKQLSVFADPRLVMVYSRYKNIVGDKISERVFPDAALCSGENGFRSLYLRHYVACSGVIARKSALERVGLFNESRDIIASEDTDLWLRLALEGGIRCAGKDALLLYRIHPGNLSRGYWKKFKLDLNLAIKYRKQAGFKNFIKAAVLLSLSIVKQKVKDAMSARS